MCYLGVHHEEGGGGRLVQELASPGGIALDREGKALAVADTGNNRYYIKQPNLSQMQIFESIITLPEK